MKNLFYVFMMLLIVGGCAREDVSLPILESYRQINYEDGINEQEAKLIAQNELIVRRSLKDYTYDAPQIVSDLETVPHAQDYWFVSFNEKKNKFIPSVYMVALHKKTGQVVFSRSYVPEHEWIIEAHFLRLYEKR